MKSSFWLPSLAGWIGVCSLTFAADSAPTFVPTNLFKLADADPVIIMSSGAITQTVPKNRIKEKKPLPRSLMLSAEQMGLDAQTLADVTAFLRTK